MLPLSLVQGNMPNTVNTPETSLCTTITATTCTIPINPAIKPYMSLYQSCRLRESELRALEVYYAAPRVAEGHIRFKVSPFVNQMPPSGGQVARRERVFRGFVHCFDKDARRESLLAATGLLRSSSEPGTS
jgi:hypothetical protein